MYYLPITYAFIKLDESIVLNAGNPDLKNAGIEDIESKLYPIYPNPIIKQTWWLVSFLNKDMDVSFSLCSVDGKQISLLQSKQYLFVGQHTLKFTIPDLLECRIY